MKKVGMSGMLLNNPVRYEKDQAFTEFSFTTTEVSLGQTSWIHFLTCALFYFLYTYPRIPKAYQVVIKS